MNNKQEILKELKEISPVLFNVKENEKALVIPENYFNEMADVILFHANNESGILNQLKKERPEIPSHYFENFSENILSKIKEEEHQLSQTKTIALPKKQNKIVHLFTRVAMAASIIGAVFLVKQVQQPALPVNDCKDGIACLTQDEIYNYMNANSTDFNLQEIKETVKPVIEKANVNVEIDNKTAVQYIEENKNILETDDASTDIF